MVVDHMSTGSEHATLDSAASSSEESYLRPTNAFAGPEGSGRHNESTIANDTEITEGGWICRVERIEKHDDFNRRNYYYREGKQIKVEKDESQEDLVVEERRWLEDEIQTMKRQKHKVQKDVRRSIIAYYYYTTKKRGGFFDLEAYIKIRSPLIMKVLRENAKLNWESLEANEATFHEPYQFLWRQYYTLKTCCEDMSYPSDSRTHIKVLVDFLESCPEMPNALELSKLCDPTKAVQSISYASLWSLFTPGTLVVAQNLPFSEWGVSLVDSAIPPTKEMDRKGHYVYSDQRLIVQNIEYNGTYFEFRPSEMPLKHFLGLSPLAELRVVPLSLVHGYEKRRDLLVARGRKFWDLRGLHMKGFVDPSSSNSSFAEDERVMVDWAAHSRVSYERPPPRHEDNNDSTRALINGSQPEEEETDLKVAVKPFTVHILQLADVAKQTPAISTMNIRSLNTTYEQPLDSELILCTWLVWGFSFQSKLWCQYHVDNLVDVDFHKKSFDRLVLREDYKTILKAMVAQHFTQGQHRFQDLVAGKGQGLNILLHGPPGVGKTLTAECIADLYERPLYSVTSGDLGTDPEAIEQKLHRIFDYAVAWNAVLLLDEADVFLAERNLENLTRNALVSVFLRMIEYFNGVFFLTTNRVGTIDEAFQSRLHITLGIDPLSVEDRRQIWYHFIKDLKHLSKDHRRDLARHAREDWCHQDFNGRQVRNTVKTALTLARQDGVEVQARHFQIVLDIGSRFAGYMQRLKKMDRERLAEAIGTRLDLTANTLRSPEVPIGSHAPKKRTPEEGLDRSGSKDLDLDWD